MEEKGSSEPQLVYQILCDDVRLEIGNKLSLMGVFHEVYVQRLPVMLPKIAIVTQWRGEGNYTGEIRILSPDRVVTIASSPVTSFQIPQNGYADNITFFLNLHFERPGNYLLQTYLDSNLFTERFITVGQVQTASHIPMSSHIN